MIGAELKPGLPYIQAERPPTKKELELWKKAQASFSRVNLLSYLVKTQWANIKLTNDFAIANKIDLGEPDLPDIADRMFKALNEIEALKKHMCAVNGLALGVRISANGHDLDIVEPRENALSLGWVLPAIIGAVIVVGIIARWAFLEKEVGEITAQYNGVLRRSDMALCEDENSALCKDWQKAKATGGYYKRETIIDSVKNAVSSVGTIAKKGLGMGLALAIPVLLLLYMPRRRKD